MASMRNLHAVVAATSGAPMDWLLGTAASVVFVAVIAVPAAVLNTRERKRRQRQAPSQPTQ
jgi:hypothetical protein